MRLACAAAIAFCVLGAGAQAMPALHAGPDRNVLAVEGGCGPGGHRGPDGRCYPNYRRYYRPVPVCRPGFRPGRYFQCVPNF